MPLKVLDGDGQERLLSIRQVSSTRNSNVSGSWDQGLISQTEVYALPEAIETAITNLSGLIETIKSADTFHSSVDRVNPPDAVLTQKKTFSNPGTLSVTDTQIPDPSQGKTMAYCDLKASSANEGPIYLGSATSGVNADNGREIDPGEPVTITIDNLSKVAVYSPSPGNSFSYIVYYES